MAELSERVRAKLVQQFSRMWRETERSFAFQLEEAGDILPDQAEDPLFPFIVRMLGAGSVEDADEAAWLENLPNNYRKFRKKHSWLLDHTEITGDVPEEGLEPLARLLIALRDRQRLLEGK